MGSEPTTPTGARLLNYHRSYKGRCGVHEDELAPMVAEAEAEAAQQARALADELAAALHRAEVTLTAINPDENYPYAEARDMARAALAKWEASR